MVKPGDPSAIRIENTTGDVVEIARDASGKWVLEKPRTGRADQAAAQAAATQVGALRSLSTVHISAGDRRAGQAGLYDDVHVSWRAVALTHCASDPPTPIQDGYYAQLDDGAYPGRRQSRAWTR